MTTQELFMGLVANDQLQKADAVILLEGDGFTRIEKACNLITNYWASTLVFSGGIENHAYGSFPYAMCQEQILALGVKQEQIIVEAASKHTRQQAEEIIAMCQHKSWTSIILVATHYHQYRAFLTFLKVLEEKKLDRTIRIINAPAPANWFQQTNWGKRIDLLQTEFDKIEQYKQSGHISDYQTAIDYFTWKELQ